MTVDEQIKKAIEKVEIVHTDLVRSIAIRAMGNISNATPVGNPALWKANATMQYARETHNLFVDAYNADINSNTENFTKRGNLKRGVKRAKKLSGKLLKEKYTFSAGKLYSGGRARANWNISVNTIDATTTESTEKPNYTSVAQEATSEIGGNDTVYISNNLPYIARLNDGYSKQAPVNFVEQGLALAIRQAETAVKKGGK